MSNRFLGQLDDYRVKPFPGGYVVWQFYDWDRPNSGYRPVATALTLDKAWQKIAQYLGLEPPEHIEPAQIQVAAVVTYDYGWP